MTDKKHSENTNIDNFNVKFVPVKSEIEKKEASTRSKKNWQDPIYVEKNLARQLEGSQDPVYKQAKSKQMKEIAATAEWQEKHKAGRSKIDYDEVGRKVSKSLKEYNSTPEATIKRKKVSATLYTNPEFVKNRYEGFIKARGTPCMTDAGAFATVAEAGEHYNKIRNFNNGAKWVKGMIKKCDKNFYYITREEYDFIKGNVQ
jgi:hypothetical protein